MNQFNAVVPGSDASRNLRQMAFGFYVQDDIQARKNLTLNLGCATSRPTRSPTREDRLAQLIDFTSPTATLNDTTTLTKLFKNPSLKTVAPRVGFAWDVAGDGKTAIRGGVGMFYDLVADQHAVRPEHRRPRAAVLQSRRPGRVEHLRRQLPRCVHDAGRAARRAGAARRHPVRFDQPLMTKWNVNVQREISAKTVVEVGYSGSHGENLVRQIFTNGRVAQDTADGRLFVAPGTPLAQPNFGRMRYRVSDGTSDYNGLTVGLTRRLSSGLQAQVSYTFSKSQDDGAAALGGNDFTNEVSRVAVPATKDRGLSPFDVRHSLVANVNYLLPFAAIATGVKACSPKAGMWRR